MINGSLRLEVGLAGHEADGAPSAPTRVPRDGEHEADSGESTNTA